jgi:DNA invertase Pin-like site-specific DNA recombinase
MKRVAIYARVSRDSQNTDNQLLVLREWATAAGHTVIEEYVDQGISGAAGEADRPQFARMMEDAHKRRFGLLLVWSLDRLTREGMPAAVNYLSRLGKAGVSFHSYTEPLLSTDNEMVRDVVLALMASMAKMERERIRERTIAGIARARANGKTLGRPNLMVERNALVREGVEQGLSIRQIARETGISVGAVHKIVKEIRAHS